MTGSRFHLWNGRDLALTRPTEIFSNKAWPSEIICLRLERPGRDLHLGPQMMIRTPGYGQSFSFRVWSTLITQTRIHLPPYTGDEPVDHGEACELLSMKQYCGLGCATLMRRPVDRRGSAFLSWIITLWMKSSLTRDGCLHVVTDRKSVV